MTHEYNIAGMTCDGCVAKVKSELLKLGNVTAAEVQLIAPQAVVTTDKHIPLNVLQRALGNKYIISESANPTIYAADAATEARSYYPIFLIFGYILGITLLIEFAYGGFSYMRWMNNFMAGFFLLFSFFKLLNLEGFATGYSTYDIIAKRAKVYGYIYPFIELGLGIALLIQYQPLLTNTVTLCVMAVSTVGVVQSLIKKSNFECACLGTIIKLPLSKVTLFEDLLMVVMSGITLISMIQ